MYNPDFWEICLDPRDLDQYANESGIWYESPEERQERLLRDACREQVLQSIMTIIGEALTERQRQVLILYYLHQKTQEEVARIMGISRRVVSQHLFGIYRNGRRIDGAIKKIRKLCRQRGIVLQIQLLHSEERGSASTDV